MHEGGAIINNARKLTLLEKAIKRVGDEARRRLKENDLAYKGSLSEEIYDLRDWRADLDSSPDQRDAELDAQDRLDDDGKMYERG